MNFPFKTKEEWGAALDKIVEERNSLEKEYKNKVNEERELVRAYLEWEKIEQSEIKDFRSSGKTAIDKP